MKKRIFIVFILILLISSMLCSNNSFAEGIKTVEQLIGSESMQSVSEADIPEDTSTGIVGGINTVIGLLQLAGSGISIIVVTLLGAKYILASPADKADVKKSITPIIIGCVLLFGAVNLVATIMDFSDTVWSKK